MTDFLLELRSEEIPARMQAKAREDLARLFAAELAKAGLAATETLTYATPRRLALIARGLPDSTLPVNIETKGPRTSAPPQAIEGFLRKIGGRREDLVERDGVLFHVYETLGVSTSRLLAEAIPAIVRAFPWPKSMRWGAASASTESLRWVRPLHGIVALLGEAIVPVEIAGVTSGATTLGHRFHHPGAITIGSAGDYAEKLRACHVLVDPAEREAIVRERAHALAADAGLALIADEGLVAENAGLTEWPVPLLGRFDPAFLDVPPEVIQLTARVNQKYFVCRDAAGALANAFVCTANIEASDGGAAIVEGNRKVLAARLSDARFFYETDLKVPLEEQAKRLDRIVFHEKLGTVADKVARVAKLARWLVEEGIVTSAPLPTRREGLGLGAPDSGAARLSEAPTPDPSLRAGRGEMADLAERAARLAKADLVTGMVGEFPELQGVMGGYYAAAQGEHPAVAAAIRDHYKPVGQGDEVPTDPVTVAVSLADKLDTIVCFFAIGEKPSGSKDPFAIRRATIGAAALSSKCIKFPVNSFSTVVTDLLLDQLDLRKPSSTALTQELGTESPTSIGIASGRGVDPVYVLRTEQGAISLPIKDEQVRTLLDLTLKIRSERKHFSFDILTFFADRLKVQQREAGVRHDLIDAVFALGGEDDLVRLLARVRALQAFVGTEDGANLLAGYKRAANILKKEGWGSAQQAPLPARREGLGVGAPDEGAALHPGQPTPSLSFSGRGAEEVAPAEAALVAALDAAEPRAAAAVAAEDFEAAMTALASLRAPIDAFFEQVIVNDSDPATRARRLDLLARVRAAVQAVADFSRIEG